MSTEYWGMYGCTPRATCFWCGVQYPPDDTTPDPFCSMSCEQDCNEDIRGEDDE